MHASAYARTLRPLLSRLHHRHLNILQDQMRQPPQPMAQRVAAGVAEVEQGQQLADEAVEALYRVYMTECVCERQCGHMWVCVYARTGRHSIWMHQSSAQPNNPHTPRELAQQHLPGSTQSAGRSAGQRRPAAVGPWSCPPRHGGSRRGRLPPPPDRAPPRRR